MPSLERGSVAGDADVFPVLSGTTQFNHAGVAPLPRPVAAAVRRYLDDWSTGGPQPWAYQRVSALRALGARAIGAASAEEIAIVPNTSTGLATVACGLDLGADDVIVTTSVEFPANRYPWDDRGAAGAAVIVVEPTDPHGHLVDDAAIVAAMRHAFPRCSGTRVLALSHVQFATGQQHDLPALIAEAHALGGLVCVDGIQSVGQMPLEAEAWGVDFLSADGHKWMLGPEGCGLLYVRRAHLERLRPPLVGWWSVRDAMDWDRHDFTLASDARRYEPGCLCLAAIVGLAAGLELLLDEGLPQVQRRLRALAARLADGAQSAGLAVLLHRSDEIGNGIVALDAGGPEANRNVNAALRRQGIHGSVRRGVLRLSPHFYNTMDQVQQAVDALRRLRA